MNGFAVLHGDGFDAVIVATILEHWFNVLAGHANWSDAGYFYPYTRTIAHTDAYFLIGLAYAPFRLLGLDPFLSIELAGLVLKAIGFAGAYLLGRKVFSLRFNWACFAAVLFTLSNAATAHGQRVQLATVAFVPIMSLLVWNSVRALLDGRSARLIGWGLAAGLFFGAWCLTCFYMAWFFAFFLTVFALVALALVGRPGLRLLKEKLTAHAGSVVLVAGGAVVSLLPFVYAFLPKSRETGVRPYELVVQNTVPLEGILQVGQGNILFGRLYNRVLSFLAPAYTPHGEYYDTGFTLVLFALFVCGCVWILRTSGRSPVLRSVVVATLASWLLVLNLFGHSAWFFVHWLFPGAKALNVVGTYQIFLAVPVVMIAIAYLSKRRLGPAVMLPLAALLLASELNKPYMNLDRREALTRIAVPSPAPRQCHAFYVSGWKGQDHITGFPESVNNSYAHNVTAMMIAQSAGIPTLNGIASFNPPDWDFADPNRADYDQRMLAYARKHEVSGLCHLDLNSKQWSLVGF